MTPEHKFLNTITTELKTQPGFNLREEVFFPLRYDRQRPVTVKHQEIAQELMPKDPRLGRGDYATSIGTTSQNVVQVMVNLYQEELKQDDVNLDILVNGKQGKRGTWQVLYHWLWNHKYPRWLKANSWELLQEKAVSLSNWLQFLTNEEMESVQRGTRGLILPSPPPSAEKVTPKIPKNQSLWMVIDLNFPNYQLLLFTRSEQEECLLCPSSAYAPNSIIEKPPILLPQKGSWADQNEKKQNFMFEEVGTEEFLAIAVEKPFSLPWLTPCQQEALPELNAARICELFEQLGQQENWQVFYQSFEVVKQL